MDTHALQAAILANKRKHGWNTTDMSIEMLLMYKEMAEVTEAYYKHDPENLAEELADVVIYALGMAEMNHLDLGQAIEAKVALNAHRVYDAAGHKHLE